MYLGKKELEMPKGKIETKKENTLLFIDANIYLDFYRIRDSELENKWLKNVLDYAEILIMTEQCHMEILKNRHRAINESLMQIKKLIEEEKKLIVPAFISEKPPAKKLSKHIAICKKQIELIQCEYTKVLDDRNKDNVFISIKKIIDKIDKKYYLSRSMNGEEEIRFDIRELAKKRFSMGYPPRKPNDTNFVDALNWEWIIYCANKYKKHIVIVTRDNDYGLWVKNSQSQSKMILNDWLKSEFQERVSPKKKILIFNRLSLALKHLGLDITKAEIDIENEIAREDLSEN